MLKKVHILKEKAPDELFGLGISTSEPDLKITMLINSGFNLNLTVADPIIRIIDLNTIKFFRCYFNQEDNLICHLIKNRQQGFTLFQAYPKIDFFLLFQGIQAPEMLNKILLSLKTNPNISLVIPVDAKKLKGIKHII